MTRKGMKTLKSREIVFKGICLLLLIVAALKVYAIDQTAPAAEAVLQDSEAAVEQEYHVGTGWNGGECEGLIGTYIALPDAKNACALAGYEEYRVYGEDGEIVWPTDKTTIPQKAVRWAIAIAKDDTHGYNNADDLRTGNPDYACSSFVACAYRAAGLKKIKANAYTAKMRKNFLKAGFVDITDQVDMHTGEGMRCGDVVLRPGVHVEMVTGKKHNLVGARGNATGGAMNGEPGDQGGSEIAVMPWWDDAWVFCLRYMGDAE